MGTFLRVFDANSRRGFAVPVFGSLACLAVCSVAAEAVHTSSAQCYGGRILTSNLSNSGFKQASSAPCKNKGVG